MCFEKENMKMHFRKEFSEFQKYVSKIKIWKCIPE